MTAYLPSLSLPSYVFDHPAAAILLPVALGTAVGFSTRPSQTQKTYLALRQPPLRPPPAVFGPVWTSLYGLMGYASHRAFTTGLSSHNLETQRLTKIGLGLYTVQLGLNLVWMPLFFSYKRPIEASVDIVALTASVGGLIYTWSQVDEVAAWCLAPYAAWLGFATYLSIGAGYLNDWNFEDKERPFPPGEKGKGTRFVDERDS